MQSSKRGFIFFSQIFNIFNTQAYLRDYLDSEIALSASSGDGSMSIASHMEYKWLNTSTCLLKSKQEKSQLPEKQNNISDSNVPLKDHLDPKINKIRLSFKHAIARLKKVRIASPFLLNASLWIKALSEKATKLL